MFLTGAGVFARGRRFQVLMSGPPAVAMVHVQIDHHLPLAWTAEQRLQTEQAIVQLASAVPAKRLQIDFEVRRSERPVLLQVLSDVRRAMHPGAELSMTALASWCETETWLNRAPVDEVVPMLFRMGPQGQALTAKLEAGGDFANPRCRSAVGISVDTPLVRAPADRRVYVFDPRSWTIRDYALIRQRIDRWSATG